MNASTQSSPLNVSDRRRHAFGENVPVSSFLPLTDYERDLCRRLALSQKTAPSVKQMARLLLELDRQPTMKQAVERTGVSSERLLQIRQRYLLFGLQEALGMHPQILLPASRALKLTDGERVFCQEVLESGNGSKGRLRRARALLMMNDGKSKDWVAKETTASVRSLERLIERYQTLGAEGAVNEAERSGRPMRYPKSEFIPLIKRVIQQQTHTTIRWTAADLRKALAHHRPEAACISMPTLRTLVVEAGFSYGFTSKKESSKPLRA